MHRADGEQLFLDDALVARRENVRRQVVPALKLGEPVLEPDRPWESGSAVFGTVLQDGGLLKMWYLGGGHVCYAESEDGTTWTKPALDAVELQDGRSNVVIERGAFGDYYELFGVLKDEADPDPSRRYKMSFLSITRDYDGPHQASHHPGSRRGLSTAVSADGIHWAMETEFASDGVCDISRMYQQPGTGRFVLYGRAKLAEDCGPWRSWGWGRAVTRIESDDFRTWSEPESGPKSGPGSGPDLVLAADEGDREGTEIYSLPAFEYNGLHIGMPQMFYGRTDQGNLEIQLATSRDGHTFERCEDRTPFLPEGGVGEWDRFNIALGCLPPVTVGDEWWFYYSGRTYRHGPYDGPDTAAASGGARSRTGLATCPRGRLAALEASFDGGAVETVPLTVSGTRLHLNADARWGTVGVTLLDAAGQAIEGGSAPVQGQDGVDVAVPLAVGAAALEKPVVLRLELHNARVYGFTFA